MLDGLRRGGRCQPGRRSPLHQGLFLVTLFCRPWSGPLATLALLALLSLLALLAMLAFDPYRTA